MEKYFTEGNTSASCKATNMEFIRAYFPDRTEKRAQVAERGGVSCGGPGGEVGRYRLEGRREERKHSAETAKHVSLVGAGKGRRKQTCSDTDAKETIEMITETLLASCLDNLEADGIDTGAAARKFLTLPRGPLHRANNFKLCINTRDDFLRMVQEETR